VTTIQLIGLLLYYRKRGEKVSLQTQLRQYRQELSTISQADEFAKYSKIQRKLRAASDQLNSLAREDLELNIKYSVIGKICASLLAAIFFLRFLHQVYSFSLRYFGHPLRDGKVPY